jgi:hypothetical protein
VFALPIFPVHPVNSAQWIHHPSTVTAILVSSDCTLIFPWLLFRLLAVKHHPVGVLLPLATLKPFSSSRFCVAHISNASMVNSTSSSFVQSFKFIAICGSQPVSVTHALRRGLKRVPTVRSGHIVQKLYSFSKRCNPRNPRFVRPYLLGPSGAPADIGVMRYAGGGVIVARGAKEQDAYE